MIKIVNLDASIHLAANLKKKFQKFFEYDEENPCPEQ